MGQMEVIPGHPDQNTAKILAMIAEAREQGADIVIFTSLYQKESVELGVVYDTFYDYFCYHFISFGECWKS